MCVYVYVCYSIQFIIGIVCNVNLLNIASIDISIATNVTDNVSKIRLQHVFPDNHNGLLQVEVSPLRIDM